MNTGEHQKCGGAGVQEGWSGPEAELAELRRRLEDGLACARLTKTQLAQRAGLGRTTVSEALNDSRPVPSAQTVAALARALRLEEGELLELRRVAAGEDGPGPGGGTEDAPGRPISEWDAHDLEVHPADSAPGGQESGPGTGRALPGYIRREHDLVLARAVEDVAQGRSRMLVLVGSSSTGKTRACWEAAQPLAGQGWRLWHPFDPTRATAALADLHRVQPHTVVWLNEAQHYLGDPHMGEEIAAALHNLLTTPEHGPLLILGTLWPEYADRYTALPSPGSRDPHSRVRELLAARTLTVPEIFDQQALRTATALAEDGDALLADALARAAGHGRVTQDLAGAPELLRRYQQPSMPAVKALLEAAMDARRLGVGLYLPQAFLIDAAIDYLDENDFAELAEDWAEAAFADLARPVHGKQAPLRRAAARPVRRPPGSPAQPGTSFTGSRPVFRMADYLEQHGRTTRKWLCPPASFWHAAHTHLTRPEDLGNLTHAAQARHRLQWAHHLRRRAADAGDPRALSNLAWQRARAGDREGAEAFYHQAADAGDTFAFNDLARLREEAGDREGAEAFYHQAADAGDTFAFNNLARLREEAGDRKGAEAFYHQAADAGNRFAFNNLARLREEAGDRKGAEAFYHQALDAGDTTALSHLALLRARAGDREGAEAFYHQAADAGDTTALDNLARLREVDLAAGDILILVSEGPAVPFPNSRDFVVGPSVERKGDEAFYRQAADAGDTTALVHLARLREEAGDREGAEAFYHQALDAGNTTALRARSREEAGGPEGLWPYGLDPDGTPTPPWQ
jgi:transcriptional regulator with XRE-family HTH domain/Tfp pilus assembly protein PilF